jgi:hypothetical protein
MNKYSFDKVSGRYQNSVSTCQLLRDRFKLYRDFYDSVAGQNGVIQGLNYKLAQLASLQTMIKQNIANIKPSILDYRDKVT